MKFAIPPVSKLKREDWQFVLQVFVPILLALVAVTFLRAQPAPTPPPAPAPASETLAPAKAKLEPTKLEQPEPLIKCGGGVFWTLEGRVYSVEDFLPEKV